MPRCTINIGGGFLDFFLDGQVLLRGFCQFAVLWRFIGVFGILHRLLCGLLGGSLCLSGGFDRLSCLLIGEGGLLICLRVRVFLRSALVRFFLCFLRCLANLTIKHVCQCNKYLRLVVHHRGKPGDILHN